MTNLYPHLFSPIDIGPRTVKNRICCSAHADSLSVDGMPQDAVIKYYEMKARGGAGFIMCFGSASVHPSSPAKDWNGVELFEDRVIPWLQKFSDTMHRYESPCVAQITHRGRRGRSIDTFEPLYSPSDIPEPNHRERPHVVDKETLRSFIRSYAEAAWRLKEGGFDGCEIMASHGHLIDQFWSLNSNQRHDEFGGNLDNRLRFGIEVMEAIREKTGDDFIIGIRISGDDFTDGGLAHETCCEIASVLDNCGILNYFNVMGGTAETYMGEAAAVPDMSFPLALYTPLSAGIRESVQVPVIATGRINDPVLAENILKEGQADLCIMNRALIADPFFPQKAREGRNDDIRQCMGYNQGCIDRIYAGHGVMCVQNPFIGRELQWESPDPVGKKARQKIIIVGAGPAGLECARNAALAGHKVTVIEKDPEAGGQTKIAAIAPSRQDFSGSCRYNLLQCEKEGVEIRLNTLATAEMICAESPDAVIIATGALPFMPDIPGVKEFAYNAWEILTGAESLPQGNILIIDEEYGHQGPSTAEFLSDSGYPVEIATSEATIAGFLGATSLAPVLQRIFSQNIKVHHYLKLKELTATEALMEHAWGGQEVVLDNWDAVVLAFGGKAEDSLYHEVKKVFRGPVFNIGDSFAPRTLQHAVYEGQKIIRQHFC